MLLYSAAVQFFGYFVAPEPLHPSHTPHGCDHHAGHAPLMNMSMDGLGGMDLDDHQQQSDAASNASLLLHAVLLHASPPSPPPAPMPPAAPPPAASGNLWLGALSGQPGCAAALGARLLI